MKLSMKKAFSFLVLAAMIVPNSAFAQATSAEMNDLQNQVKELTRKVATLESSKGTSTYVMPTEGDAKAGGLVHAAQNIDMGGYVATTYTEYFDQESAWQGRVFDANEGFALNQADIWFKKDAAAEGGAGFKIDILTGKDAVTVSGADATGSNGAADDFTIKEGYIEVNTPTPFGDDDILPSVVNWKAGRFVTLAGKEVINPQDNWNISRSVAFGFGLPFVHNGLRTNSKWFNDKVDFYAGINNGWDNSIENNSFRTVELGVGFSPFENVKYFTTMLIGPEGTPVVTGSAGSSNGKTFLWTHVLDWSVSSKLNLGFNIDWGKTMLNRATAPAQAGLTAENGEWAGFSGYGKYQINDKWSWAERLELFRDVDGTRNVSGSEAGTYPVTSGSDTYFSWTHTLEYRPYDNLITRLEYRWDRLNAGNGSIYSGDSSRNQIAAQVIYVI